MGQIKDPPHTRLTIDELTNEQIDKLISEKREARMRTFKVYSAAQEKKKEIQDEKNKERLTKQLAMLLKNIERIDKALEAAQDRANKVRALRLELDIPDI